MRKTLILGNQETIDDMSTTSASVLTTILKLIDKYDLYGQVAYPKHHKQSDVPDIYRLAAKTKGVFINPAFIEPFGLTLIEAAAHGLPIVATKNGGPVDIHRVLDNGLLVDPHDQNAIADALYKLVSDKQLWAKCRQNGLNNIHLFSWPEHCRTYLSKIATCRPRHPQWQKSDDDVFEASQADSPNDSLRDIQDISLNLKLSFGEKGGSGSVDNGLDFIDNINDRKNSIEKALSKFPKGVEVQKMSSTDSKLPTLRRRKHLFVIAVDRDTNTDFVGIIKNIFEAVSKDKASGHVGFILSTSLTIQEAHSVITKGGILPTDFDTFICSSGSELYYPSTNIEDSSVLPYAIDADYHSQIEYRWGGEGLRKTLVKWASSIVEKKGESDEQVVIEDEQRSSAYCHAFKVLNPTLVPSVKELRKLVRIQALRCHVIYSCDGTKLHVIPVLASRSQALRYLHVRWGIELSSMVVFVGETGDTDYDGLLGGVHKTVILKGACETTVKELHARGYPIEDVVAFDSPNNVKTEGGYDVDDIQLALQKLGIVKK